jgi:type II secretory pathway pseudopilin PulG
MRTSSAWKGLTFSEVLIIIVIIILFFGLAARVVGPGIQTRAAETKALNNAKTVGFCCKEYAIDHNGQYPTYTVINGTTSTAQISDYSNTAFNQCFPVYLQTIQPFYQPNSAWTPKQLDDPTESAIAAGKSLPAGSNEWAYVAGLSDTSNSIFPLIADGFADLKTHTYTTDVTAKGGVWKGQVAIVVFCDESAEVVKCDPSTHVLPGSPNRTDLFDTTGQPGWMTSTGTNAQTVLNPR